VRRRLAARRVGAECGVFLAVAIAGALMPFAGARGDSPSTFGWWTSANPGAPTEPVPTIVPVPAGTGAAGTRAAGTPSDIPAGGFEVAKLSQYSSYAAIGYYAYGATVGNVVLDLDTKAANVPNSTVQACPLTGAGTFGAADGAPSSQGPAFSCSTSVPGVEDASAGTVSFAAAPLVTNDYLGIAIVAVGTSRMVFEPPGQSTVQALPSPSTGPALTQPTPPASDTPPVATAIQPSVALGPPTAVQPGPAPSPATPTSNLATSPPAPSRTPATGQQLPATAVALAVTTPSDTIGIGSSVIGVLLVLCGSTVVVARNRRNQRAEGEHRSG
jgi:hypothetical protein